MDKKKKVCRFHSVEETWVNFRVSLTSHSSIIFEVKNDPRLGVEEQTGELYNDRPNGAVLYVI